ncbi:hypothetical protein [Roseinatronobacter alkalisoli]|uniref:P27 family phage terminase small subunit n=1 Tax=Roseinatronobacter alkalisoli TaxID=3028235 RepID=A0ABT5TE87_9RHOB|nr:hypothetical protein [Roseinatronobacter sp. HJB301]MDD7973432.1 hypothetical protein [Roseinatronobacter sp. HJB301]
MDPNIKDAVCNDWCDLLSQYTLDEVRGGVAAVFAASGGRLKSINEFQVQDQIQKAHKRFLATLPKQAEPDPERKPVDRETADEIMAEFGFRPRRFGDGDA